MATEDDPQCDSAIPPQLSISDDDGQPQGLLSAFVRERRRLFAVTLARCHYLDRECDEMRAIGIGLTFIGLLAAGTSSSQTVYRCKDPKGQTAYQQVPCSEAGAILQAGRVKLTNTDSISPPPAAASAQFNSQLRERLAASVADRNIRMHIAVSEHRVEIGMTELEVLDALGQPTKVNTDLIGKSKHKQWIYRRDGGDQYVYTEDGVVTAVQDRPDPKPSQRCYTRNEIRNANVYSTISPPTEVETIRRTLAAKMRPC